MSRHTQTIETPTFTEGQRVLCKLDTRPRPATVQIREGNRYRVQREGERYPVWCDGRHLEAMGEAYEQPEATTGPAFSVELPAPSPCPLCGRC